MNRSLWTSLAAALGVWLGIQSARMAFAMIIWNTAEDNTTLAGEQAAALWIAGIVGALAARRLPFQRREVWLAALFGLFVVLRQGVPGENSSPAFAYLAWAAWMWWLPAFLDSARGEGRDVATGVILGVALQVAGQIVLHGLDLELVNGPASVVAALVLAVGFVLTLRARGAASAGEGGAWGAFALGPFLFVELTLLANLGRIEVTSGTAPLATQLAAAAGLVFALLLVAATLPRAARLGLSVIAVVLLIPGQSLGGLEIPQLVLAQAGLGVGLAATFDRGPRRLCTRTYLGTLVGLVVFFVLIFVFYSYRDTTDWLWPMAAALVVAPGVLSRDAWDARSWRPAIAAAVALLGAMALAAIPPVNAHPTANATGDITVLQYNVHEGLDYWSVPSAEALVDRIESANADLVALEEVNRGWDLSAGIDFFSYLRWRLPQYHAYYGRMDTALFGNAILSRYDITDCAYGILPHINSVLNRGYASCLVNAPAGPTLFVATHFTAYEGFDAERIAQADAFAAFWAKRPRAILAGDYNAHPQDTTITRLIGSGLVDAPAAAGIGTKFTYSSGDPHERIDYVFVSPDVQTVRAEVLGGTASDHSPVLVVLRLR